MTIDRDGQRPDTYQGLNPRQNPPVVIAQRAPATTDRRYPIGTQWIDKANDAAYALTSVSAGSANWEVLGSATGAVATINSLSPSAGNITVAGTSNEIDVASTGSTVTLSLSELIPQSASVTMTATEVKALATTPITLVAAPGAGKVIHFLGAQLKLDYGGSNAFTEAGDNLGIKYTDASGVQVCTTIECTGFIDQTADTYTNAVPSADAIVAATGNENQALVLDNLGSNFAGNAADDNALIVSVLYRVVTI